jgi:ribosomal protein S21
MAVIVQRKEKEKIDSLLKRFNEKIKMSKVIPDFVERMNYTKKSTKKRMKKYSSIKRYKIKSKEKE